jgi:hypothetical protein
MLSFLRPDTLAEENHTIYVAKISWHTGIVIPATFLPDSIWPSGLRVEDSDYLEIGWGDRHFYPHPGFNFWYAINAIFWPTSTTLHVNPLKKRHIHETYSNTKVAEIQLDSTEAGNLAVFLIRQFDYDKKGKVVTLQHGLYPGSRFFA